MKDCCVAAVLQAQFEGLFVSLVTVRLISQIYWSILQMWVEVLVLISVLTFGATSCHWLCVGPVVTGCSS